MKQNSQIKLQPRYQLNHIQQTKKLSPLKAVPYNNNILRNFDYTNANTDTQESPIQKRKLSTEIKQ